MGVTNRLIFDATDAASRAASANVGAWVRAGVDGELIDSTSNALHVLLTNASVAVTATDLDIRDLDATQDSVESWTHDGTGNAIGSTGGALDVNITNAISVSLDGVYDGATNTDPDNVGIIAHVRNASPADAHQTLRSTGAAASSDAVVAANVFGLDMNAFGMLYNGTTWDRARGTSGAMHIHDGGNSITVDAVDLDIRDLSSATDSVTAVQGTSPWVVSDAALANTAGAQGATSVSTSGALVASPLSNRKYLYAYNNGNKEIYLGFGTVTALNGFPMFPGQAYEFRAGAGIALNAFAASAQDARYLELS